MSAIPETSLQFDGASPRPTLLEDWDTPSTVISGVEDVIRSSRFVVVPDESEWHDEALNRSNDIDHEQLAYLGTRLLEDIPYDQLNDILQSQSLEKDDTMFRLRMGRKLFLIARDAIVLTTDMYYTADYTHLQSVCRSLGILADTQGKDTELAHKISRELTVLKELPSRALDFLHNGEITLQKIERMLHKDQLVNFSPEVKIDTATYHTWRKDFRRIVNSYALLAGQGDDDSFRTFASQGMIINTYYGTVNDTLDKAEEK